MVPCMTPCRRAAIVIVVALAPMFGASVSAEPKTVEIVIEHFAFMPPSIKAAPGDIVVFTNRDLVPHTATAVDGAWTTQDIARGKSEVLVVPANGAGVYFCRYHPAMRGRLIIPAAQ